MERAWVMPTPLRVPDYSIAPSPRCGWIPGDVRAVLVDTKEDPLSAWAMTDVHRRRAVSARRAGQHLDGS